MGRENGGLNSARSSDTAHSLTSDNHLFPGLPGTNECCGDACLFLYEFDESLRVLGQCAELRQSHGGLLPAREHFVLRFCGRTLPCPYANLLFAVEHIEFGDVPVRVAVDAGCADEIRQVEPAAAPGAAGGCAVLPSSLSYALSKLPLHLREERPGTYAGAVGFGNADAGSEHVRRNTKPLQRSCGRGGTACDERVRSVVDVEQRCLCAFHEERFLLLQ